MPHLFDPLTLRGVTLRNRIGMSPMCQYSAENGMATDWHLVHLGSRAAGGAGMVMAEATAVEARGRISPEDLGIWSDDHIKPLQRATQFIKAQGAVAAIQLAHAGRKAGTKRPWAPREGGIYPADGGWSMIAPSAVAFADSYHTPQAMTQDDIQTVIQAFQDAARRSLEAGFECVEVHSAHGYLLHSFLSPLANKRDDDYGGSFENRIRLLIQVVRSVRQVWPEDKPLLVRISATDWHEDGWSLEDSIELAIKLKPEGVDLIDCSSGGILPNIKIPVGAGYQVPLAEGVRKHGDIPTAAVGMITQPMQADELIRNGRTDMVLLGRELLRDPYWPIHAAEVIHQSKDEIVPPQYRRGY